MSRIGAGRRPPRNGRAAGSGQGTGIRGMETDSETLVRFADFQKRTEPVRANGRGAAWRRNEGGPRRPLRRAPPIRFRATGGSALGRSAVVRDRGDHSGNQ